MKVFKKKESHIRENPVTKIAEALDRQQRRTAGYLDRKTQYWNRGAKITALVLFCLIFGGLCLLFFIRSIVS